MERPYRAALIILAVFLIGASSSSQAATVTIKATVNGICGNGELEYGEQCDGADLGANSCASLGYASGDLSCNSNCTLNTSACVNPPPLPPTGGGGGGWGYIPPSVITSAVFSGFAFPKTRLTLLKDAQIVASITAGDDGSFKTSVSNLSSGNYIFSIYAVDINGVRSPLTVFPISITGGATTYVSGIFISPTITTDKSTVRRGDTLTIFGQSVPEAKISIVVNSDNAQYLTATADDSGKYVKEIDTTPLEIGQHTAYAKASARDLVTDTSNVISFTVGTQNIKRQLKTIKGDLNNDNRVDIVDFSIAAYWFGRKTPPAAVDINGDGKVNLTDFSILAYNWTG